MTQTKFLFLDRDGTLIQEPFDQQIDSIEKFALLPDVIWALQQFIAHGYRLVMISNQDGLGTDAYPEHCFERIQNLLLNILASQGITFDHIFICPHLEAEQCTCRKPRLGLLQDLLVAQVIDKTHSLVIGDRKTDVTLAENLGILGLQLGSPQYLNWRQLTTHILTTPRIATYSRQTNETKISVTVNLDGMGNADVATGIGFLDHMLAQLAKHGDLDLTLRAEGDLDIDDHHTVEDIGIVIGQALHMALGDKRGIARYGFLLPMDEALAEVALDLSGRGDLQFKGMLPLTHIGALHTEMVPHFFKSLAQNLKATLHLSVTGNNIHHMVEALFKGFGRAFAQAKQKTGTALASTKGVL